MVAPSAMAPAASSAVQSLRSLGAAIRADLRSHEEFAPSYRMRDANAALAEEVQAWARSRCTPLSASAYQNATPAGKTRRLLGFGVGGDHRALEREMQA